MGRLVVTLVLSMLLGGCSVLFNRPLKQPSQTHYIERCTETYAAPIVDTVVASVLALSGFAFAVVSAQADGNQTVDDAFKLFRPLAIPFVVISAAAVSMSAGLGYIEVGECREESSYERR